MAGYPVYVISLKVRLAVTGELLTPRAPQESMRVTAYEIFHSV